MIESKNMLRMPFFVYNADEKSHPVLCVEKSRIGFFS